MGLLIVGLAFLAGLGVASVLSDKAKAADVSAPPRAPVPPPAYTGVGYAAAGVGELPKANVGDVVASFPHGMWGRVVKVNCGADGGLRYVVDFQNGTAVELRGAELTR